MTSLQSSPSSPTAASQTTVARTFAAARYLLVVLVPLVTSGRLRGEDTLPLHAKLAEDFLAGLRERGWHDVALEYLEGAEQDPLATPAFLQNVGYERATTQVELARQAAGEAQRQALLAAAAAGFQNFAAEQSASPLQLQALATAGNLFLEQGLDASNQAAALPAAARRQREQLQDRARDFLDQARQPLQTLLEQCGSRLKSLPKAAQSQSNPDPQVTRQQLQAKQAEAKFLLARLDFEASRTYAPDSKSQQRTLAAAAAAFARLYEEYDDKLVGFYGRLYQGRSYQAAGKFEQALECYGDIVNQPPIANPDFRRLVSRAYRYRAECQLTDGDVDQVIKECSQWLDESRGPERSEPDWLAVSYQLASAYDAKAAAASGSDAQKLRSESRRLYREIAKGPGEFQLAAKAKTTSPGGHGDKPIVVKTFDEAFSGGTAALEQLNSARLAARLAEKNNPDSVESLNQQARAHQAAALQYFQQAVELSDPETDREQLVTARFYLCWLYWEARHWDDAAVIGEFLARRYPESRHAPAAAKLALAAYESLYNAGKQANESTNFEAQQLTEVAELLVRRWPESPEAETALNLLINMALRGDRLADAEQLLQRLPASGRAAAELRIGVALWSRYLQASRSSQAGPDEAAVKLMRKAGELLASGYQHLQSRPQDRSPATAAEATGVLYFVQLLLAQGEAEQAVAVLEDASVGPLSLVASESPAAQGSRFEQETYKTALRAFVSVQPPQRDKAQEMMAALESVIGNQGRAQQKLIDIYVSLGLQLRQQISALTAEGRADQARGVAAAFEDLLARVTERAGLADNWKVQNWIAQTNLQLGQGLSGADAARYYRLAEEAYQRLLAKAEQDPKFAPTPIAVLAARKRLADCLQAEEKYAAAFELYTSILRGKPNLLELQQAAAAALQQWGTATNDAEKLEESIRGAMPEANSKNLVWGWLRIASIADQAKRRAEKRAAREADQISRIARYENLFFEARYRAAQARFAAAQLATGADRQKQLGTARQSLESMQRLYPQLGGPQWQGAYRQLLEQMEQQP